MVLRLSDGPLNSYAQVYINMACYFDLKKYGDITKLICCMHSFCRLWLTYIKQSAIDSENYPSCTLITDLSHRSRKKET